MARKKAPAQRKIRTREHVIADLAVNHVERQVLVCGYTLERIFRDYGIDLVMFTYNQVGEVDEGQVLIQVKATERTTRTRDQQAVIFRLSRSDLQRWLAEPMPLILIVYDASMDAAWWLYVQRHFQVLPGFNLFQAGKTLRVYLPIQQRLDPTAVREFAMARQAVLAQLPKELHQ